MSSCSTSVARSPRAARPRWPAIPRSSRPTSGPRHDATDARDGEQEGRPMTDTAVDTALLEVRDLHASYGPVSVLHGLNFSVKEGEVVVVLGANGAGKTTTLRAICQMVGTRG